MVDYTNPSNRVQSAGTGTNASAIDQGLRTHMLKVYNYMGLGLALSGVFAMAVMQSEQLLAIVRQYFFAFALVELGMVWFLSARINKMTEAGARFNFFLYAAVNGFTLGAIFAGFTGQSVARVFFISASMFGVMSLYGYTTKKDLTGFGKFLMMGLIGLLIAMVVNIFLGSPALHFATSAIGVLIFTGLIAYDTQKVKDYYYHFGHNAEMLGKSAIMGALALYLDFINLMIMLLQFFGDRE